MTRFHSIDPYGQFYPRRQRRRRRLLPSNFANQLMLHGTRKVSGLANGKALAYNVSQRYTGGVKIVALNCVTTFRFYC